MADDDSSRPTPHPPDGILIADAVIVNEGRVFSGDVLIRRGRIAAVGGDLAARKHDVVVEAAGRWLLPGLIDSHVHFREPGLTHKGDIASESRAAVAGGVTSFMDMPNTLPPTTSHEALAAKRAIASGSAHANFAFYFGAAETNIAAIEGLDPKMTCGLKVFMGASTGDMRVGDTAALEKMFARSPVLVAAHCEDTPTIAANEARYRRQYGEDVPMRHHPDIRSREACLKSSSEAVALARRWGTRLHVLHISSAEELALFEAVAAYRKQITCEACVHHLFFDDGDYEALGTRIKCNPAIKSASDRMALIRGLREDRIATIATDHAPHTREEKEGPYFRAPSGLPLVQYALPALLEHCHLGLLDLPRIVEKTSHAVARLFDVKDRGFIREDYWADLVLVNLDRPHTVTASAILGRCGWSPFEGRTFRSSVDLTLVNGRIVYRDGRVLDPPGGKALEFDRA